MSAKILRGIVIPLPTVFDHDGEVDEPGMRELVEFYVEARVHGFFVCGSFGMGPAMSVEQRKRVTELVAKQLRGRLPFIVHCGTVDVYSAIDLARHARTVGAIGIGIVPPFYYSDHTDFEIIEHYRWIAEAVDLPMVIYDNPQYSGIAMPVDRVLRIKAAVPSVRGIKLNIMPLESALDYLRRLPDDVAIYSGGISNLMAGKPKGFDGVINPPTAHVPEICVEFWDALEADNLTAAARYHSQLDEIAGAVMRLWKTGGRVAYKEALKLRGLDIKMFPRWPSRELSADDVALLRRAHEQAGAAEFLGKKRVRAA